MFFKLKKLWFKSFFFFYIKLALSLDFEPMFILCPASVFTRDHYNSSYCKGPLSTRNKVYVKLVINDYHKGIQTAEINYTDFM